MKVKQKSNNDTKIKILFCDYLHNLEKSQGTWVCFGFQQHFVESHMYKQIQTDLKNDLIKNVKLSK